MPNGQQLQPQFQPSDNVTERQLRWGLWWTTHRLLFKKIGYGALIAVGVGSWLFTFWGVLNHFFIEGLDLERDLRELASRPNERLAILQQQRPQPIQISDVFLIPNGGGSFDAAARVVNPNSNWLAEIEYDFNVPGATSEKVQTVLLPGRERWLVRLNAASSGNPSGAALSLLRQDWRRISKREIGDAEQFIQSRFNLEIREARFVPSSVLQLGGASAGAGASFNISRALFTVTNQSAYGLREPEFVVLLRRDLTIVGINKIAINDLQSRETRSVAATWFKPLGLVTAVEVFPFVNVFNQESFVEP